MRILGIDYGRKRIGLSLSDAFGWTAQPCGYFENGPALADKLKGMVRDQDVAEIVVGRPLSMSGRPSEMTKEAEAFARDLRTHFPSLAIHLWDERLSTAQAERLLVDADVRRAKRREVRDAMAASILLQAFLNSRTSRSDGDVQ